MLTLVLGGTRSGKSEHAERLAASTGGPVTYVATAQLRDDGDHAGRIAAHRRRRPGDWATVETGAPGAPALAAVLRSTSGTVLVDSLGSWLAGHPDFAVDGEDLVAALRARDGTTVVVSEEVGSSVHPATAAGRAFADALGLLNQGVSAAADEVHLVVAGRALVLP